MEKQKIFFVLGMLLLVASPVAYSQKNKQPAKKQPAATTVPSKIAWTSDIKKAFEQSKKQGKLLMIDFYTDW